MAAGCISRYRDVCVLCIVLLTVLMCLKCTHPLLLSRCASQSRQHRRRELQVCESNSDDSVNAISNGNMRGEKEEEAEDEINRYKSRNIILEAGVKRLQEKNQKLQSIISDIQSSYKSQSEKLTSKYESLLNASYQEIRNITGLYKKEISTRQSMEIRGKEREEYILNIENQLDSYSGRLAVMQQALEKSKAKTNSLTDELAEKNAVINTFADTADGDSNKNIDITKFEEVISEKDQMLELIESNYLEEIEKLEAFIDKFREDQRINAVSWQANLDQAQEVTQSMRTVVVEKDLEIGRLKSALAEATEQRRIDVSKSVTTDSISTSSRQELDELRVASSLLKETTGVLVNSMVANPSRAALHDYLMVGDMREQRLLLEKQTELLTSISSNLIDLRNDRSDDGGGRKKYSIESRLSYSDDRELKPYYLNSIKEKFGAASRTVIYSLAFLVGKGPYSFSSINNNDTVIEH